MNAFRDDLTVVVITKNEEKTIASIVVEWSKVAPVLIVDSGSWDRTVEVAEANGARVLTKRWLGYGRQKQFAIGEANTKWVLSIDADEWPNERLKNALQTLDLTDRTIGYAIQRENYFLGNKVRFCGWNPDIVLRLFHRDYGHFDERIVHEKVIHHGTKETLPGALMHFSYRSEKDIIKKSLKYARLSATQSQKRVNTKLASARQILGPYWTYFKIIIIQLGFLDGATGFRIARMRALSTFRKYQILSNQKP